MDNASRYPRAAWTTLRVAHIPTASTSEKTFSLWSEGRSGTPYPALFPFFRFPPLVFPLVLGLVFGPPVRPPVLFYLFPVHSGCPRWIFQGAKVSDLLRKIFVRPLRGGSRAHRFTKGSSRPLLRPTTPTSVVLFRVFLPSRLAWFTSCLTYGHAQPEIPPFNPPFRLGMVIIVLTHLSCMVFASGRWLSRLYALALGLSLLASRPIAFKKKIFWLDALKPLEPILSAGCTTTESPSA